MGVPLCPIQWNEVREIRHWLPMQQISAPLNGAVHTIDMTKRRLALETADGEWLAVHVGN
jgi:hypothetical protein